MNLVGAAIISAFLISAQVADGASLDGRIITGADFVSRNLAVTCGKTTYSLSISVSQLPMSVEFETNPVPASEKLIAEVSDALRQFSDIPHMDAYCGGATGLNASEPLVLDIRGPLWSTAPSSFKACLKRGGIFDLNSHRLLVIEDNSVTISGEGDGSCITISDVKKFNRLNRDAAE